MIRWKALESTVGQIVLLLCIKLLSSFKISQLKTVKITDTVFNLPSQQSVHKGTFVCRLKIKLYLNINEIYILNSSIWLHNAATVNWQPTNSPRCIRMETHVFWIGKMTVISLPRLQLLQESTSVFSRIVKWTKLQQLQGKVKQNRPWAILYIVLNHNLIICIRTSLVKCQSPLSISLWLRHIPRLSLW